MSEAQSYPDPIEDADNRPLLAGWREGRLMLQRCRGCGARVFYPRPMCPSCWSAELDWEEATGRGEVVSFTRIYRPNHPAFFDEVPIVLAEIRLAEGPRMLARVMLDDPTAMRSGMAVALVGGPDAARLPLPTFEPSRPAPGRSW